MNQSVFESTPSMVEIINKVRHSRGGKWGINRDDGLEYFNKAGHFKPLVNNWFYNRRENNITHVDICGNAEIQGCSSYGFSCNNFRKVRGRHRAINGDLFSQKDYLSFLEYVKKREGGIDLITFIPVAGLIAYGNHISQGRLDAKTMHLELEKKLIQALKYLNPLGMIFSDGINSLYKEDFRNSEEGQILGAISQRRLQNIFSDHNFSLYFPYESLKGSYFLAIKND